MTEEDLSIPSNRIRFALVAMKEFEAKPNCKIDMSYWRWKDGKTCYACCGGAAWFKLHGVDPSLDTNDWVESYISPSRLTDLEESLDEARYGDVGSAFCCMGFPYDLGAAFDRHITDYMDNQTQFYADMEALADDLEEAGY